MKYFAGVVVVATFLLVGTYLGRDTANKPAQKGSSASQALDPSAEAGFAPVPMRSQPLRPLIRQGTAPRVVSSDSSVPVFYPDDEYMQLAAEHLMAEYRMSVQEVERLSDVHVLLELVEPQHCEKYSDEPMLACATYFEQSPILVHPYFEYPLEALESMANSDGVAAAVLAKRIGAEDVRKARAFAMRSAIITGKVGPLLLHQQVYGELALAAHSAPIRLSTGINKGLPFAIAMYALDAVVTELGNPLPPLDPRFLESAPAHIQAAVDAHKESLKEEYRQIRRELGLGNSA